MSILEEYADVLEQTSVDEAYLDCTKKIKEVINIEEYAAKIKSVIKQQCGLLSSIAVASTKSIAKIASDYKKPDGLTIVYPNDSSKFLEPLEVGRISGIGTKILSMIPVRLNNNYAFSDYKMNVIFVFVFAAYMLL